MKISVSRSGRLTRIGAPPLKAHTLLAVFGHEIDTASFKNWGEVGFCEKSEGFDTAYSLDSREAETDDTNRHRPLFEERRPSKVTGIGAPPST